MSTFQIKRPPHAYPLVLILSTCIVWCDHSHRENDLRNLCVQSNHFINKDVPKPTLLRVVSINHWSKYPENRRRRRNTQFHSRGAFWIGWWIPVSRSVCGRRYWPQTRSLLIGSCVDSTSGDVRRACQKMQKFRGFKLACFMFDCYFLRLKLISGESLILCVV